MEYSDVYRGMEKGFADVGRRYVQELIGDGSLPCEDCGIRDDSVKYSQAYEAWLCTGDFVNRNMAP